MGHLCGSSWCFGGLNAGQKVSHRKPSESVTPKLQAAQITLPEKALSPAQAALRKRPEGAVGTFLRVITINDVYQLEYFPHVASAVNMAKAHMKSLDCVVTSCCNGDFISPCTLTALDGGRGMITGLNAAKIQYLCLGNHEFDIGFDNLKRQLDFFEGAVINSNVTNEQVAQYPKFDMLAVGHRQVVIGGFCIGDESVYTQPIPTVVPVHQACTELWQEACTAAGRTPDLFLPMTHQFFEQDKQFARFLSKHSALATRTPCILGGHEHEPIIEKECNSLIVKVGQDAADIGIVDIWWTADGVPHCSCLKFPSSDFPREPNAEELVQQKNKFIADLMAASLFPLTKCMSSENVRNAESEIATKILTLAKLALKKYDVDLVMLNGGNIRGRAHYDTNLEMRSSMKLVPSWTGRGEQKYSTQLKEIGGVKAGDVLNREQILILTDGHIEGPSENMLDKLAAGTLGCEDIPQLSHLLHEGSIQTGSSLAFGLFTMGDLYQELPWETELAIVSLPGRVIFDAVNASRSPDGEKPCFLHLDAGAKVSDKHEVLEIDGKTIDFNQTYTVAVLVHLLTGMDNIAPLVQHVQASRMAVPDLETCKPLKFAVLDYVFKDMWRQLLGIQPHSVSNAEELKTQVGSLMKKLDKNVEGFILAEDLKAYVVNIFMLKLKCTGMLGVEKQMLGLANALMDMLDSDKNGLISVAELEAIAY